MKTLITLLVLAFPLLSMASVNISNQKPSIFTDVTWAKGSILLEKGGVAVSAWNYTHDGVSYATLEFKNTTNKDIRLLWSIQLRGVDFPINMDGTTQAYLTIPAGESITYGESNSEDPLIELESYNFEREINIHLEIQKSL